MSAPTPFSDLNEVLAQLVSGLREVLTSKLCGAYLQGSFALGDADEFSDVDFIVATNGPLDAADEAELQALHARIFALPAPWAQHLEGSYAPTTLWKRVDPQRAPLLYLDNGARELVWDDHCNTAIVRWCVRERGIVLAGPGPRAIFDPVSSDDLRADAGQALSAYRDWAEESRERYEAGEELAFSRWKQPYLVLTSCRALHTLATGTVGSKREAGEWALASLDSEWGDLIEGALADRSNPWGRVHQPATPSHVARTCAFATYSRQFGLAGSQEGRKAL